MINIVVSVFVFCKSISHRRYSFIPVPLLIALYELAILFETSIIDDAWIVERILMSLLLISVLFIWRKKQLHVCGFLCVCGAFALRFAWGFVYDWFLEVMQYPGSDAIALMDQAMTTRSIFDTLITALILVLQILMLCQLRKQKED